MRRVSEVYFCSIWYWLTWIVLKIGSLNEFCCCVSLIMLCFVVSLHYVPWMSSNDNQVSRFSCGLLCGAGYLNLVMKLNFN